MVGFAFTAAWEMYRHRRDVSERELGLIRACRTEFAANEESLKTNALRAKHDRELIAEHLMARGPLLPLHMNALDLVLLAQPSAFSPREIVALSSMRSQMRELAETMRSLGDWKLHGTTTTTSSVYGAVHLLAGLVMTGSEGTLARLPPVVETLERAERRLEEKLRFDRYFDDAGRI